MKSQIPLGAKKQLIGIFFNSLGNLEKVVTIINGLEARGYNTDGLYWMSPDLTPTIEDLKEILSQEEYRLTPEQIQGYLEKYSHYDKTSAEPIRS